MAYDLLTCAYLAGLFDGEGTIHLRRRGRSVDFGAVVAMTDEEPVRLLAEAFGGHVHAYASRNGHRPVWRWAAYGQLGEEALRAMLPFLRVKRQRAEVALAVRGFGRLNRWTDPAVFAARDALCAGLGGQ